MKDEVEPCRRVYFVAHAAELDKCPGELMVLYVMMTGRFVGLLGWPWFRREEFLPAGRVEINGA